jgi:hypothetical protein
MARSARIVQNLLTGGIAAIAAIFAVGCGSQTSGTAGQATTTVQVPQSSVSAPRVPVSTATARASSPAASAPTGAAPAGAAACSSSNLHITLGNGGAAAGTDFTVLDFTNVGASPCTLYGFPGVSMTNSAGAQIGAAATRNPSQASAVITLTPGAKANATLGVGNAENYPATACKPTATARLKVFPPNQTQAIEVPFSTTGCAVASAHQLSVTAVTAGAGQTMK